MDQVPDEEKKEANTRTKIKVRLFVASEFWPKFAMFYGQFVLSLTFSYGLDSLTHLDLKYTPASKEIINFLLIFEKKIYFYYPLLCFRSGDTEWGNLDLELTEHTPASAVPPSRDQNQARIRLIDL